MSEKIKLIINDNRIKALIALFAVMCICNISTANILSVVLLLGLYYFFREKKNNGGISIKVLSGIFGFIMVACARGKIQEFLVYFEDKRSYTGFLVLSMMLCFIGMYLIFLQGLQLLYTVLPKIELLKEEKGEALTKKHIIYGILICMVAWAPYLLLNFPGVLTSDSVDQLSQAMGVSSYSNHHPWIHTLVIQLFYQIGFFFTQNPTISVAFYTVFQMLFLASIVSCFVVYLYNAGVKNKICIGILAYYTIVPYNAVYAITMWKDVLFGAVVFLFSVTIYYIYRMDRDKIAEKEGKKIFFFYFILGVATALFRSNGWYAVLLCIPVLTVVFKKYWKSLIIANMMIILSVCLFKGPLMEYYNVSSSDFVESLSIPIQQVARVVAEDKVLTDEQIAQIEQVVSLEALKEEYAPLVSDPIKDAIRDGNQQYLVDNKLDYFLLWVEIGIEHPVTYFEAYREGTEGYYYPDVQYWNVKCGVKENELGVEVVGLYNTNLAYIARVLYENWYRLIPIGGLLASIGSVVWLLWILIVYCIQKKEWKKLMVFLPVVAIWLSILVATPLWAEFRYIYSLFYTVPLFIVVALHREKKKEIAE